MANDNTGVGPGADRASVVAGSRTTAYGSASEFGAFVTVYSCAAADAFIDVATPVVPITSLVGSRSAAKREPGGRWVASLDQARCSPSQASVQVSAGSSRH